MDKEELKKIICDLIDKCKLETLDFDEGEYSNIFVEGISFTLEGSYVTKIKESLKS